MYSLVEGISQKIIPVLVVSGLAAHFEKFLELVVVEYLRSWLVAHKGLRDQVVEILRSVADIGRIMDHAEHDVYDDSRRELIVHMGLP